jgi:YD repeat-containing protein
MISRIPVMLLTVLACCAGWARADSIGYGYDPAGRLTGVVYSASDSITYAYDDNGNLLRRTVTAPRDTDADGVDDGWEMVYFGDLDEDGSGDPDGDDLANSNELANAGNPLLRDTDVDGQDDNEEYVAGTLLDDPTSRFHISRISLDAGDTIRVSWDGVATRTYQLSASDDPRTASWDDVNPPVPVTADGPTSTVAVATTSAFFRVKVRLTE